MATMHAEESGEARSARVFISYAQESEDHSAWVLALADRLRAHGIDAWIDQFEQGFVSAGWRTWMTEQIRQAHHVLVVCTEEYEKRFEGNAPAYVGRGVRWESQHITQALYDAKFVNDRRFIPVLRLGADAPFVPFPLKDYTSYRLDDDSGYDALYRLLTDQPATPARPLGVQRKLPPLPRPGSAQPAPKPADIRNPYPGLAAFRPEDSEFFFGREDDTARVVEKLRAERFVSLCGGSGTGKSSLAAAGVDPALRTSNPGLTYLRFKPQGQPLRQLAEALDRALPEERGSLFGPRVSRLEQWLLTDPAKALEGLGKPVLLLADQFEELFTQTDTAQADAFRPVFEALGQVPDVLRLLTLRSEFMGRLADWLPEGDFARSLVHLQPITQPERLRRLIRDPAERCGVAVERDVEESLVTAASTARGALPLVALTLHRLFDQRDPGLGLTLKAYRSFGELAGVVQSAAARIDEALNADPALAAACDRLFGALATVIDEVPARRTAPVAPLRADPAIGPLVEALRAQGFLADPDDAHVELAHESLLWHWPRLADWCRRYGDQLALRRQAEQAARDWERSGRLPALRWTWEREKPAVEALLALAHRSPQTDPAFTDPGIHAWRALEADLPEPLRSFLAPEPLRLLEELKTDACPHQRREEIGLRLNQMGDPRRGVGLTSKGLPDIEWIDVPAGRVTLNTRPPMAFDVEPFRMARYPVTWAQYDAFLKAEDGFCNPAWWSDLALPEDLEDAQQAGERRWGFDSHPAINVSWFDAMAYGRWLGSRLGLPVRLPTEWEWQWAASSPEGWTYPWGNDWQELRANINKSGIGRTTAVGMYPLGRAGLDGRGGDDLSGNVWEWCLNEYDEPQNTGPAGEARRVLRGGSWNDPTEYCRASFRHWDTPDGRFNDFGFRLVVSCPIPGAEP
ncbi:SUMF1/EgtB/PvdO family nonheme iron enzyme [Sphaerotilus microaerophilus]|uniref:SEFIR domain-containing protein n=1 Tax=Sphaerotilus microaerophilus TaxID=2914710 RepID=A0ABN6PMB9_9BURK|nr:SUMF1/EgtB/PvdO family nonheme iron enzyme [Sphaerotilus sp. FB-5]BDI04975.1 hypothetical protein CATMQ487_19450 [Sphaerotilus sp. FB-5]